MKTLKELLDARAAKQTELDNVLASAKKEGRDDKNLNDAESTRCDAILDEIESLDVAIKEKRAASGESRATRLQTAESRRVTETVPATRGPEVPSEDRSDPVTHPDSKKYSLFRAINRLAAGQAVDGYEAEISQEMARRSGKTPRGFYMPMALPIDQRSVERRAFDTTAAAGGIQTVVAPTVLDALRNKPLLTRLGATVMSNMVGTFDLPKQTGTGTAYWVGEATAPTASAQAVGQVAFTPSTLGAYTDVTRRLTNQVSFDAELLTRNDLVKVVVIEMDRAGFNGSGSGSEPTGILQNSSITKVALGTNGAAPTWASICGLEAAPAVANADDGSLFYVTSNYGRSTLKQTTKVASSTFPIYLWENGRLNDMPAFASNQLPSNLTKGSGTNLSPIIYGDFSTCVFAFWTGIDVSIDPFSLSTTGGIRIVVLVDCTFKIRQTERLAMIVDMTR